MTPRRGEQVPLDHQPRDVRHAERTAPKPRRPAPRYDCKHSLVDHNDADPTRLSCGRASDPDAPAELDARRTRPDDR